MVVEYRKVKKIKQLDNVTGVSNNKPGEYKSQFVAEAVLENKMRCRSISWCLKLRDYIPSESK